MPVYNCTCCNFSTHLKSNYSRHNLTKKHRENINNKEVIQGKLGVDLKVTKSINTNEHKIVQKKNKQYICKQCYKSFTSKPSMKRHISNYCKPNKNIDYKELYDKSEKEKKKLYEKISELIYKVGDTNIQNNIILNSFGNEDISHITDTMKTELMKVPFGAIPKMIQEIHFNQEKPENHNIILPNKRDNKLMIYKNNKWIYKDKNETITDLVDSKYNIIDDYYESTISNNDDNNVLTNYIQFRKVYDDGDKEMIQQLKKECELVLLNNRK